MSDVFLVVLTDKYVASSNCRRELKCALQLKKPMVIVKETDVNHGGKLISHHLPDLLALTQPEIAMDSEDRCACEELLTRASLGGEDDSTVEWFRESHLRQAALRLVVQKLVHARASLLGDDSGRRTSLESIRQARARCSVTEVYISEQYAHMPNKSHDVLNELSERFDEAGFSVRHATEPADAPFVILLTPTVFDHDKLVDEICSVFSLPVVQRPPIVALYSTSVPFATYMDRCPGRLKELGFFDTMFQKWPQSVELQRAAVQFVRLTFEAKQPMSNKLPMRSCFEMIRRRRTAPLHVGDELDTPQALNLCTSARASEAEACRKV